MSLAHSAPQRILLTGQRGYLGQCLAALISADPALELLTPTQRLEKLPPKSLACEAVIHTACHRAPLGTSSAAEFARDNETATATLLAALSEKTPILYTSTHNVYGTAPHHTESARPQPQDLHGQSKLRTEYLLQKGPHPVQIVRLTGLWGPGVGRLGRTFLDQCMARAKAQQPITLLATPTQRDQLYVWDAARWLLHMLKHKLEVPVLNLAGPVFCLQDHIRQFCAASPYPVSLQVSAQAPLHPPLLDTSLWHSLRGDFALTPAAEIFNTVWKEELP